MLKRIGKYITKPEEEEEDDDFEEEKVDFLKKKREKDEKKLKDFQRDYHDKTDEKEDEMNPIEILYCTVCDKKLFSKVDYDNHMESKKHMKLWKGTIRKEIEEDGFRSFLIKKNMLTNHRTKYNKLKYLLYLNSIQNILK